MSLKDIFFEPDDNDKKSKPAPAKSSPKPSQVPSSIPDDLDSDNSSTISSSSSFKASQGGGGVDDFIKLFKNAMKDHPSNTKGPNYYEFIAALEKMKSKAMDDKTKYESIFAGFDVQGITPKILIDSARQYQNLFASKKIDFEAAVNQSVAQNVEAKKTQIQTLKAKNKNIDDQMLALNQQKLSNEETVKKLSADITKASVQIESNKADFNTAFEQMNQDIENNIQKITDYLGNSGSN